MKPTSKCMLGSKEWVLRLMDKVLAKEISKGKIKVFGMPT
jgi:hypothetical protein